jgi:hypothetical protein
MRMPHYLGKAAIGLLAILLVLLGSPAIAGGLRIGVVELSPPADASHERRIASLIANDFLPTSLERAFANRYGIFPIVDRIPKGPSVGFDEIIASARKDLRFDIIVFPEIVEVAGEEFYQLRVVDLRPSAKPTDAVRSFAGIADQKGPYGLEVALRTTSERIASAILENNLSSSPRERSDIEGVVQVWCIVPAGVMNPASQIGAADITINLPSALVAAAKEKAPSLVFIGLGHKDYFFECRPASEGAQTLQQMSPRPVLATYVLSGQLLPTSQATPQGGSQTDLWLRLFVEDRRVGRTVSLPPLQVTAADLDIGGRSENTIGQIGKKVLDEFVEAVKRPL